MAPEAVPHFRVNVQEMAADFYVFSGHKLFAPMGIGVLYGKQEELERMPPWQGGGSMIEHVTFDHITYQEPPLRFEAGTPSIADAVGLGAAIDFLTQLDQEAATQYEEGLLGYATRSLAGVPGLCLYGTTPHKVGVLSFNLDGIPPDQVARCLDREGIAVRRRPPLRSADHAGATASPEPCALPWPCTTRTTRSRPWSRRSTGVGNSSVVDPFLIVNPFLITEKLDGNCNCHKKLGPP